MAIALHGNLRDFGMGEVFQLIGQQRKTGALQVRGRDGQVELRFDEGRIVSAAPVGSHEDGDLGEMLVRCGLLTRDRIAELERSRDGEHARLERQLVDAGLLPAEEIREVEDLLTRETIFDLLRWADGSFRFVAQPIRHDREPESLLGAEQVLMDGLRMVDEWSVFAAHVPPESTVFRRKGTLEEFQRSPAGREASPQTERVYLLVDGRSSVRRILDLSRLGTFAGMRSLVELRRAGWIEPAASRLAGKVRGAAAGRGSGLRSWAAAVLPLLLLAAAAFGARIAPDTAAPGVPEGIAVARAPLAEARARFETARLRNLMEAYRLAEGRWPASLREVDTWAQRRGGALARAAPDAYYFAERAPGPIVLSPER